MIKISKVVQICLAYDSQSNCSHCGVKHGGDHSKKELTLPQLTHIFTDLKLSRFDCLDFSDSKPTLRKDIMDIIALGKKFGFSMTLETNSFALTPTLLAHLKRAGLGLIYLNMDDSLLKVYDKTKGHEELLKSVLNTLHNAKKINLPVHVSMVLKNKENFLGGGANTQIKLCLENGAEKIRILFPSYVGNCSQGRKILCSEDDELDLLTHIDEKYRDSIYVESTLSPLTTVLKEKRVLCPAKNGFSYISCQGYVMPCPCLPIVFGDINKEPMMEIVSRMHNHPFMRRHGHYCLTRDKVYLTKILSDVNESHPLIFVKSMNRVNCYAPCNNNCQHCHLPSDEKTTADLLDAVSKVDKEYKSIHLYGGEILIRDDILLLLEKISAEFEIVLYTNARMFIYHSFVQKIRKLNIKAVKVPVFSLQESKFDKITGVNGSYQQTIKGIANLAQSGLAVFVYIPQDEAASDIQALTSRGIVSVSWYNISDSQPLNDFVLCFGARIKETHLMWLKT